MSGRERSARRRRAELSQHFLRPGPASRLIRATSIAPTDLVVEIGAGHGVLTQPLIKTAASVIAVEVDAHLVVKLRRRFGSRVKVVGADFLSMGLPRQPYVAVGNIPFGRSTEVIRKLTRTATPPQEAWLVVQRELAHRMCGVPFGRETLWSLRLKPFWHLEIVAQLKRTDFEPPPSVDCVFLRLSFRDKAIVQASDIRRYFELLDLAFQSGAPIGLALRPLLSKKQLRRLASDYRFDVRDRPAELHFAQWLGIFRFLARIEEK